jgi:CheY-like chemotaxis protein
VGEEDVASESAETNTASSSGVGLFLRIEVEDAGIGLSDEAKLTLFNPFKQAQRLAGGTGLGLYSLAKRIEALNGHYGVSNRRDGNPGSLFWFAIPYRPDETLAQIIQQKNHRHLQRGSSIKAFMNHTGRSLAARGGNAAGRHPPVAGELIDLESAPPLNSRSMSNNSVHTDPAGAATSPTAARPQSGHSDSMSVGDVLDGISSIPRVEAPKLCILLVDDSLSILKMTSMMLKRGGHKVEQADNGAVALDLILQGYARNKKQHGAKCADSPFDVVLMDLQMPVMDGLEAVRRLRASEKSILRPADTNGKPDEKIEDANTVRDFFFGRGSTKKALSTDSEEAAASSPRVGERRRSSIVCKHQLVIGVSANSDNDTMVEAMKAGFDAFIGKPFSIDAFYEVLRTHQNKVKERKK